MIKLTYTNHLMDECLDELEAYWADEDATPVGRPDILVSLLLNWNIVRHKGCYRLQNRFNIWATDPDGEFVPDQFYMDRSDYEEKENHLHAGPGYPPQPNIAWLGVGLAMAEILRLKLILAYPTVHFGISVSYDVKPFDADDKFIKNDCRVTFYAIREGEDMYGDLEGFQYNAIGILEI